MDDVLFNSLSLPEKAQFVQDNGQFIEAQDFYSFFVLVYTVNHIKFKVLYDFTGLLVSVEQEEAAGDTYLAGRLESSLDTDN